MNTLISCSIRHQFALSANHALSGLGSLQPTVRLFYLGFGLFALIIIGAVVFSRDSGGKRSATLAAIAQEIGFTFKGTNRSNEAELLQMAPTLLTGGCRYSNVMTGDIAGIEAIVFDSLNAFENAEPSGAQSHTAAAFRRDISLPYFEMGPVPILNRYLSIPGFIHFESQPDFARRYLLNGPDKDKIQELFSPALLKSLLDLPPQNNWQIKGDGAVLILYRDGKIVRASGIRKFLDESSSIAKAFFSLSGLNNPSA